MVTWVLHAVLKERKAEQKVNIFTNTLVRLGLITRRKTILDMGHQKSLLTTLAFVCCMAALTWARDEPPCVPTPSKQFEFFRMTQFWPPTVCEYLMDQGRRCYISPVVEGWTIHGLWPCRKSSEAPLCCNNSMKFDYRQIESLQPWLSKYWPYVAVPRNQTFLWKHEWVKHGTCAYPIEMLQGEKRYFNRTLELHATLHTYSVLKAGNIVPSFTQRYKMSHILQVLKKGYGKTPNIACFKSERSGAVYLDQVWLCYDKQLKPIDCPGVVTQDYRVPLPLGEENQEPTTEDVGGLFYDCPKNPDTKVIYEPLPQSPEVQLGTL